VTGEYHARGDQPISSARLRHHFASRLVQRDVPLNTVLDLLGHSTVQMSLRDAHLAPDQRREAVAKLNEKPILALTVERV
jgi:integrase